MQAPLLLVIRAHSQAQCQQNRHPSASSKHVGIFKDRPEPLPLQHILQQHRRTQWSRQCVEQLVQKLRGHHVDADQRGQCARRLQHRGGAPSGTARPLRLQRRQQQCHAGCRCHLQKFIQRKLTRWRVQGGYPIHQNVQSQQQRRPRHTLSQSFTRHNDRGHSRQKKQHGNALVAALQHQAGHEEIKNRQHRHQPWVPQFLRQLHRRGGILTACFLCHIVLLILSEYLL